MMAVVRTFCVLALTLLALPACVPTRPISAALSQTPGTFSSIRVEAGPLLHEGWGPRGALVTQAAQAELRRAFAGRIGAGPALVVRINSVSLASYVGGSGGGLFGDGGSDSDYINGDILVVGPGGEVIASEPQLATLPSSTGGAWYDPASENRRLIALGQQYAAWIRARF